MIRYSILFSVCVAGLIAVDLSLAVETVRVDAASGAPRLTVDGRSVRARMFWGGPGSRPLQIGPTGREVTFEFKATEDEPVSATMHLRFGHVRGSVFLDDIRVEALDENRDVIPLCTFENGDRFRQEWTIWPEGSRNTVGTVQVVAGVGRDRSSGLQVTLENPTSGSWPDFHIYHRPNLALKRGHRYRVSLWVRAKPARAMTIAFYRPGRVYTRLGGAPSCFEHEIKLAADAGVDFVSFPVRMPWPRPDSPVDWTTTDRQCQTVLNANPDALLLPRIGMGPPGWWRDAHPDEMMVWDKGPQKHRDAYVGSPLYLRDAGRQLGLLVEHLEQKFGPHVAGYHPCGQNTGEWFYQETWGAALNGYSESSLHAWRRWLATRYDSDAALRSAWHDSNVTLDGAAVPSPEARRAAPAGLLLDPVTQRSLIDFAEFQQRMMADCVCHLARVVRQATAGKKLVVFFYGYVFEFGAIRNGPATSGNYALRQVLQCPDIDVLCSPISYFDRGIGESAPAMTATESVALAGKMWLYEDDTRTCLATGRFPGWQSGVDTIEETRKLLLRNTAQCALRNFGTWWMDLGSSGWFDDPRMWAEMIKLKPLDEQLLEKPRPFRPEVAVVVDEQSMMRVAAGGDAVTRPGVYEVRRPLGRMGAPYGQYLLDDVIAGRVHAKMYVFLTAWCLTAKQRQELLTATRGALKIWCYAPGYEAADRVSLDLMKSLTGFQFRRTASSRAWAEPTQVGKQLGMTQDFGTKRPVTPLFAVTDAKTNETLATYPDGTVAVAIRKTNDGLALFVGPPGLTSELLRMAARKAEVHLFTEVDCNVYANGPFLLLHASQDGSVEIDTGHSEPIRDLMTGQTIGSGPKISLNLKKGDTRLFLTE